MLYTKDGDGMGKQFNFRLRDDLEEKLGDVPYGERSGFINDCLAEKFERSAKPKVVEEKKPDPTPFAPVEKEKLKERDVKTVLEEFLFGGGND